jgi:DNA polymerase-1
VVKRVRKEFKVCNLAVVYQAGPQRVAAQLGRPLAEARHYLATHRQEFWPIHRFVEAVIAQARHDNVVIMQDGWRRSLPSPFSRAAAANAPIQGTAAAMYRRGVVELHRASLPLIATVHDSYVFECALEEATDLIVTVTRILVEAGAYFLPNLRLKVDVSASVPIPGFPAVGPLADPGLLEVYQRHLARAERAKWAA